MSMKMCKAGLRGQITKFEISSNKKKFNIKNVKTTSNLCTSPFKTEEAVFYVDIYLWQSCEDLLFGLPDQGAPGELKGFLNIDIRYLHLDQDQIFYCFLHVGTQTGQTF